MPHLGIDSSVAMILWIAMIVCFFLSIFWRPTVGIYLLIPLLPLETIRYRLHDYFLGAQFIDVVLLGVILGLKRQHRPIFPETPLTKLLTIYIVFTYLSMVRGAFFLGTDLPLLGNARFSDWKNYVLALALLFFVASSAIRTKLEMRILILAMCFGALLLTKGFHNTASGRDFSSFSYDLRTAGPMGGAGVNGLAAFEAQVSIFLMALFLMERRYLSKLGYAATLAGCVYCLTFALSRGGYAASLIGLLYLGLARSRLLLVGLVAFLIGWQSLVPPAVRDRVFMTADESGGIDPSAGARLTLWQEAMEVFQADPVFGKGFNTFKYGSHFEGYHDTHNVYVKVLVETGVVGLLIFLALFRKLFQIGFRLYRTASDPFLASIGLGLSGLMVAAVIANLFGDRWMYFQITGYTYACAALAVRAQQMTDESETAPQPDRAETAEVTE